MILWKLPLKLLMVATIVSACVPVRYVHFQIYNQWSSFRWYNLLFINWYNRMCDWFIRFQWNELLCVMCVYSEDEHWRRLNRRIFSDMNSEPCGHYHICGCLFLFALATAGSVYFSFLSFLFIFLLKDRTFKIIPYHLRSMARISNQNPIIWIKERFTFFFPSWKKE